LSVQEDFESIYSQAMFESQTEVP